MNIAIVMPELFFGGAETQFRMLIRGLTERGHRITVLVERSYAATDRSQEAGFDSKLSSRVVVRFFEGLEVHRGAFRRIRSALRIQRQFRSVLRDSAFEAMIVYSGLGVRLLKAADSAGIATVYSERNNGRYSAVTWALKGSLMRRAVAVTVNSQAAHRHLAVRGVASEVILNGIDDPGLCSSATQEAKFATNSILVPARISPEKGQRTVVEALPELAEVVEEIIFAGATGDQQFEASLKTKVAGATRPAVRFAGQIANMEEAYAHTDLVVLPSHVEGTPNVLLEAAARGVLCLASDIEPNATVLDDQRLLFAVRDPDSLAAKARHLLGMTSSERRAIILPLRESVVRRYGAARMVDEWEAVLRAAIRKSHPGD